MIQAASSHQKPLSPLEVPFCLKWQQLSSEHDKQGFPSSGKQDTWQYWLSLGTEERVDPWDHAPSVRLNAAVGHVYSSTAPESSTSSVSLQCLHIRLQETLKTDESDWKQPLKDHMMQCFLGKGEELLSRCCTERLCEKRLLVPCTFAQKKQQHSYR